MTLKATLLSAALTVGLTAAAFAQGATTPSQPQDPTAQPSSTQQAPTTPKTLPDTTAAPSTPADAAQQPASSQSSSSSSTQSSTPSSSSDQSGTATQSAPSSGAQQPGTTSSSSSADANSSSSNSTAVSGSAAAGARVFTGSIVKSGGKYLLHSAGSDYQLDNQTQAASFEGKDVKVNGELDQSSNTIKVKSIEPASSM